MSSIATFDDLQNKTKEKKINWNATIFVQLTFKFQSFRYFSNEAVNEIHTEASSILQYQKRRNLWRMQRTSITHTHTVHKIQNHDSI